MSGRSQRKSSRFTLQFRRPKHPGVSSGDSTQRKSGNRAELPIRFCRRRRLAVDYVELRADVKRGQIPRGSAASRAPAQCPPRAARGEHSSDGQERPHRYSPALPGAAAGGPGLPVPAVVNWNGHEPDTT